jgi:hypothetical protein
MQDVNFSDLARSIYDSFNERDFVRIMLFADQKVVVARYGGRAPPGPIALR